MEILKERLARGEIDKAEFEEKRRVEEPTREIRATVLGATSDVGGICRQKRLHIPELICPGDPEWPEAGRPEARPCRPWDMDSLRKLYIFGDSEQRAKAQKAIDDIWAGRNGWCPAK